MKINRQDLHQAAASETVASQQAVALGVHWQRTTSHLRRHLPLPLQQMPDACRS